MPRGTRLHYCLLLVYYPISALTWLLGIISSMTYLMTGATAVSAPWGQFASLYMMTIVMQLSLYFWNRLNNVSPHENQGSYGVPGIFLSALTAPIYLSALFGVLIGKKVRFVVTAKGEHASADGFRAFRVHLLWALVLVEGLAYGLPVGHNHPAMLAWVAVQLLICLTPPALGLTSTAYQYMRTLTFATKPKTNLGETQNA